jgi:hypothetical protein
MDVAWFGVWELEFGVDVRLILSERTNKKRKRMPNGDDE